LAENLERTRRRLQIAEDEQRRVSRALHDSVTQALAALATNLDLIDQHAPAISARTRGLLATSRRIARHCFLELRLLTDRLSPPLVADVGLRVALLCTVASVAERTGLSITCDGDDCPRLPDDVELALFRVVEHCLDNLTPAVGPPSVHLTFVNGAVEVDVRPVQMAAASRLRDELRLLHGSALRVRVTSLASNNTERATGAVFAAAALPVSTAPR
jgi:signal transduction histidine kinase